MSNELQSQIFEYSNENLESLLQKFKKISGRRAQSSFYEDEWVQFAVFALSTVIRQKANYEGSLFSEMPDFQVYKNMVMMQPNISFLSSWLSKIQGYSTQSGKTQKDRKNAFFRLVIRHLKKTYKNELFFQQRKQSICETQQKLNKNTISNQVIQQLQMEWSHQIKEYLTSDQILKDILRISKSKNSRYFFILHLDCIKALADQGRIGEFQFYIKMKVEESVAKIIESFYLQHQRSLSKVKKTIKMDLSNDFIFKKEEQVKQFMNYIPENVNQGQLVWLDMDFVQEQPKQEHLLETLSSDPQVDRKREVVNQQNAKLEHKKSDNQMMFDDQ